MGMLSTGTKSRLQRTLAFTFATALLAGALNLHDPRAHDRLPASGGAPAAVQHTAKSKAAPDPTCAACLFQLQTTAVGGSLALPLAALECQGPSPAAQTFTSAHAFVHPGSPRAPPSTFVAIA